MKRLEGMGNKQKNVTPKSVVSRHTEYLALLHALRDEGEEWVSSSSLADRLNLTSSTVRQDLSYINFFGISKKGYEIAGLENEIADVLGLNEVRNVVVVGAGNLGRALSQHLGSSESGFNVCGIFDVDLQKIGMTVGSLKIMGEGTLPSFVAENAVTVGILAVPDSAAQDVADKLISSGVTGILNFTSAHIDLAETNASCVDARIVACLQELSHAMIQKSTTFCSC